MTKLTLNNHGRSEYNVNNFFLIRSACFEQFLGVQKLARERMHKIRMKYTSSPSNSIINLNIIDSDQMDRNM